MKNLWNKWKHMVDKKNEDGKNYWKYSMIFNPLIYGLIFGIIFYLFTFEFTIFLITFVSTIFVTSLMFFVNWNSEYPC